MDRTLEVSLNAVNKDAAAGATFAKVALDRPLGPYAKARKAAAGNRKATSTTTRANAGVKPSDATKPHPPALKSMMVWYASPILAP
jgi:hypothetical protein